MSLSVVEKNMIPRVAWDAFILDNETNGEFINTCHYLSYHPEGRFQDASCAIIDNGNKQIQCLLPATVDPVDSSAIVSHPGTSFAGPIFHVSSKTPDLLRYIELVEGFYKKRGVSRLSLRCKPIAFWPGNTSREELNWTLFNSGYDMAGAHLGNFIDLHAMKNASFLDLCSGKRRNHIKKSFEKGLVFKEEDRISEESWGELTRNLQAKFNTQPTHTFSEIAKLHSMFPDRIRPFYVYYGMQYAAMAVVYVFKSVFHTQYLDLNYEFSSLYAHLFLIYNLVETALKENISGFSFGPSTEAWGKLLNEGLYSYKRQYGGYGIVYPCYEKRLG